MRLLALIMAVAPLASASVLTQTSIRFQAVNYGVCSSTTGPCHSDSPGGLPNGVANSALGLIMTGDGLALSASLQGSNNSPLMTSFASILVDGMYTFTGDLLFELPGNPNPDFSGRRIVVDAPLFLGERPERYRGVDWGRAWSIQPGVPVHIILDGHLNIAGGGYNLNFGLFDPLAPNQVPEPGTMLLGGMALLALWHKRHLHRARA